MRINKQAMAIADAAVEYYQKSNESLEEILKSSKKLYEDITKPTGSIVEIEYNKMFKNWR